MQSEEPQVLPEISPPQITPNIFIFHLWKNPTAWVTRAGPRQLPAELCAQRGGEDGSCSPAALPGLLPPSQPDPMVNKERY